jgi:hypothetical protein
MTITIGTKWNDRNGRECTVCDIYTTTSTGGAVVKVEYVSYHTFLGQRVEHIDNQTGVLRGIARIKGELA